MVGRLLFGSAIALTLAMPAWAQGKAPDGTYSCETRSSGNIFMEVGSLTARGGQMTYRGAMPSGWKQGPIRCGGHNEQGEPVIWVEYTNTAGVSNGMRCHPKK